jgi:hypothetical protein
MKCDMGTTDHTINVATVRTSEGAILSRCGSRFELLMAVTVDVAVLQGAGVDGGSRSVSIVGTHVPSYTASRPVKQLLLSVTLSPDVV